MFPNMGLIKTPPSTISESSGSDVPIKCKRPKGIVYRDFPVGCGPHVPCSLKLSDAPIDSQPEKPVQNSTISLEQDIGFGLERTGEAAAGCGSGYETNEFSNKVTKNHCLPPKKNLAFRCFPPECGTEPRQVSIEVSRNANDGLGISSLGNNISVLPLEETVSNVVIENSIGNFNQNLKCLKDQLVKIPMNNSNASSLEGEVSGNSSTKKLDGQAEASADLEMPGQRPVVLGLMAPSICRWSHGTRRTSKFNSSSGTGTTNSKGKNY